MAVQQRIIGGGLLLVGISIVLILIFLFSDRGVPADEAYDRLMTRIYPAYAEAAAKDDYLAMRRIAEEVHALAADTPMVAVKKLVMSSAAGGNREALALQKLLENDAFEKNLQGLYDLDGRWLDDRTHAALSRLQRALDEGLPALANLRKLAKSTSETLDKLRLGSGLEVPLPDPGNATQVAGANPVLKSDALLFRVFALPVEDVKKALATEGEGAKAKSARLVWNAADATDTRARLAKELAAVPAAAQAIERAAGSLGPAQEAVRSREDARPAAEDLMRRATANLLAGLDDATKQAFEAEAGRLATAREIADLLLKESRMLKEWAPLAPALGTALEAGFGK